MLSAALDRLRAGLPADAPPCVAQQLAGPLTTVYLGSRWEGRAVHAVLPRGADTPVAILKIDTRPAYQPRLRREHRALCRGAGIAALRGRMPAPLGLFPLESALVLAQTGLRGTPLNVLLRRRWRPGPRRAAVDHRLVLDWLAALHAGGSGATTTVEPEVVLARLADALPVDVPGRDALLRRVTDIGAEVGALPVPTLPLHGDLAPSNCLIDRGRLGVIDWEGAVSDGPPLAEILLFLDHYARALPDSRNRLPDKTVAFRRAFVDPGWLAELTRTTWRRELHRLGLPSEADDYLLIATLADLAGGHASTAHARRKGSRRNWTELLAAYAAERPGSPR